ncbi:MAG: Cof-type HAD-IIB family hydrolase [Thermomicrobiales bacterium]
MTKDMSNVRLPSPAYRLVALDLDGTVMGHDLVIPAAVYEAIGEARAAGVYVTLATGRMFGATIPFARQLGITTPLICYQGALIRDPHTDEVLLATNMPGEEAAEAVRLLLERDIFVLAYIDERLHIAERRAELGHYLSLHPEGAEIVVSDDLAAEVRAAAPTKLLFIAEPPVVTDELIRLQSHFGERLMITRSHQLYGELAAPGIGKGVALERLATHLGVPREATLAIGDQENDLSMLAWAGLGLAIGNATQVVREAADAIVPPVHEAGVAWAIRRYVLGKTSRLSL